MNYKKYLKSKEWQIKRKMFLNFWDHRCSLCYSSWNVEVHHRTYERLGIEQLTDAIVLCERCHATQHGKPYPRKGKETISTSLRGYLDRFGEH